MMIRNSTGTTLLELLIGLGILMLTAILGIPALDNTYRKFQLTSTSKALFNLTQQARFIALTRQTRVTLCPLDSNNKCLSEWQQPISIFTDANGNRRLDAEDEILETRDTHSSVEITWRGMGNGKSLHFNRQGITFLSNGTFNLRSGSQSTRLTISRLGKATSEQNSNRPPPE
jgi:type IV fimbrial biogenesis protein FimT